MTKEIIIEPKKKSLAVDWYEIWEFRELILVLTWRNIKLRYKQTLLGIFWVLLQPTVITLIFTIFFGKLAKFPSEGLPYELFVYSGVIFWTLFANGLSGATNSVISMGNVIQKIYFPRIIIPFSAVVTTVIDFIISLIPLIILFIYFKIFPNFLIVAYLPILLILVMLNSMGLGMILASLNVRFRDVRLILPFIVQIGLFMTPVIYPFSAVQGIGKTLLMLNPITGVIETFRSLLTGSDNYIPALLVSILFSFVIFFSGLIYFLKTEELFADVV